MKASRVLLLVAILIIAGILGWHFSRHSPSSGETITVYYTKDDGTSEVPWTVSVRPRSPKDTDAQRANDVALYSATQAVAGPSSDVHAIRFPAGTHVLSANVTGSTATVDLSGEVKSTASGVGGESAEFKALTWSLTALPGIDSVAVRVEGQRVKTLPGGHLELDEPLRRSDF